MSLQNVKRSRGRPSQPSMKPNRNSFNEILSNMTIGDTWIVEAISKDQAQIICSTAAATSRYPLGMRENRYTTHRFFAVDEDTLRVIILVKITRTQ